MNGKMLTRQFLDFIDTKEVSDDYASQRRIYEALDMAAGIFCRETRILHSEVSLTTIAGVQRYDLPPDFIDLYMRSTRGRFFIRYADGYNYFFPLLTPLERIYRDNLITAQEIPNRFAIADKNTTAVAITGTATAAGVAANGRAILTDSTRNFLTTHRTWPRDVIYNGTTAAMGYVLSVINATSLFTALFDGTAGNNGWTSANTYTIQPSAEKELILEAPAATSGHIMHVSYVCMPTPVFSDFDAWSFPSRTSRAIASGASAIFKMDKTQYTESKALGGYFSDEINRLKIEQGRQKLQEGPSRRRERM